jgi:hypothetical protein
MKFKVGDKVRVREDLEIDKDYGFYCNEEMVKLKGKVVEIEDVDNISYSIKEDTYAWTDEMFSGLAEESRNLIPLIAEMLGVEIGEEFKISNKPDVYKFTEYVLMGKDGNFTYNTFSIFFELISGKEKIIKLPKKPILTEDEKAILRNLPKEYKWIARDKHEDNLCIFLDKPRKREGMGLKQWVGFNASRFDLFNHLFQFIKWEDEEPYNIEELLEEK